MAKTKFDVLHLASLTDGDWGMKQLRGLSRLSPFIYIGSDFIGDVTCTGYYNCPDLAHFRLAVRQIRQVPDAEDNPIMGDKDANKKLAKGGGWPYIVDLDTRSLYFGQENQHPALTKLVPGQQGVEYPQAFGSEEREKETKEEDSYAGPPIGPEGRAVKGMPVRLQKVHFRAFGFNQGRGGRIQGETASDEYAAYFLCSSPVGPHQATANAQISRDGTFGAVVKDGEWQVSSMNTDFELQRYGAIRPWTRTKWTEDANEKTAETDYQARLVMGDPLVVYGSSGGRNSGNFVTSMNQVFALNVDLETLVLRNNSVTRAQSEARRKDSDGKPFTGGAGVPESGTMPGFGYQMPLGISLAGRFVFTRGKGMGATVSNYESEQLRVDHFEIEYLTEPGGRTADGGTVKYATSKTDLLMRRLEPAKFAYIGTNVDKEPGINWETRDFTSDVVRALCKIFTRNRWDDPPKIVTRVYADDCSIRAEFVTMHGCPPPGYTPEKGQKRIDVNWKRGEDIVIGFTTCDEVTCDPSSSSSSSTSFSSSSSSYSSSSHSSSSKSVSSESSSSQSSQSLPSGWTPGDFCDGPRGSSSSSEEPT